jgi:hypothetical protein
VLEHADSDAEALVLYALADIPSTHRAEAWALLSSDPPSGSS